MESEISRSQLISIGLILLFCGLSNAAIVGRIWKKNRKDVRPLHVYQMNYFTGISFVCLVGSLVLAGDSLSIGSFCPALLVSYFLSINNIYDIVILQLDRLLAVSKPLYYKSRVHTGISIKTVFFSKLFPVMFTCVGSIIDPVFIHCPVCTRCIYVHSVNVYTVAYPSLAAILLTLVVSIYVSIKANKLNSIQPIVVLPVKRSGSTENPTTSTVSQPTCSRNIELVTQGAKDSHANENAQVRSEEPILNITCMLQQLDEKKPTTWNQPIDSGHNTTIPSATNNANVIQTERP